jgi:hypothetical protein
MIFTQYHLFPLFLAFLYGIIYYFVENTTKSRVMGIFGLIMYNNTWFLFSESSYALQNRFALLCILVNLIILTDKSQNLNVKSIYLSLFLFFTTYIVHSPSFIFEILILLPRLFSILENRKDRIPFVKKIQSFNLWSIIFQKNPKRNLFILYMLLFAFIFLIPIFLGAPEPYIVPNHDEFVIFTPGPFIFYSVLVFVLFYPFNKYNNLDLAPNKQNIRISIFSFGFMVFLLISRNIRLWLLTSMPYGYQRYFSYMELFMILLIPYIFIQLLGYIMYTFPKINNWLKNKGNENFEQLILNLQDIFFVLKISPKFQKSLTVFFLILNILIIAWIIPVKIDHQIKNYEFKIVDTQIPEEFISMLIWGRENTPNETIVVIPSPYLGFPNYHIYYAAYYYYDRFVLSHQCSSVILRDSLYNLTIGQLNPSSLDENYSKFLTWLYYNSTSPYNPDIPTKELDMDLGIVYYFNGKYIYNEKVDYLILSQKINPNLYILVSQDNQHFKMIYNIEVLNKEALNYANKIEYFNITMFQII